MLAWGLLYLGIAVVTAAPYYPYVSGYPPVYYNPGYPQYVTPDTFYNPYFFHLPHVYSHHLKPFSEPINAQREIQVEDQIPASKNFARTISVEDDVNVKVIEGNHDNLFKVDQGSASPVFLKFFHYKPIIPQIIHAIVSRKHKKKDKNKNKDENKEDIEREDVGEPGKDDEEAKENEGTEEEEKSSEQTTEEETGD